MEPFVLLDWGSEGWTLASPVTIGLAQQFHEVDQADKDPDGYLTEREVYERGWRWCECYSARDPDGASGHIQAERLLPLGGAEFDAALMALESGPAFFGAFVAALPTLVAL